MSALSLGNNWAAALELFTTARTDPRVLEHPQTLESGLIALSTALGKAGTSDGMLRVVHFMLEHHIKVIPPCIITLILNRTHFLSQNISNIELGEKQIDSPNQILFWKRSIEIILQTEGNIKIWNFTRKCMAGRHTLPVSCTFLCKNHKF